MVIKKLSRLNNFAINFLSIHLYIKQQTYIAIPSFSFCLNQQSKHFRLSCMHACMYAYVCMHAHRKREREREHSKHVLITNECGKCPNIQYKSKSHLYGYKTSTAQIHSFYLFHSHFYIKLLFDDQQAKQTIKKFSLNAFYVYCVCVCVCIVACLSHKDAMMAYFPQSYYNELFSQLILLLSF